jgi:hypothetical protein
MAAALVIAAVAVAIAGCSGGSKDSSTLSGADIFDPHKFSMATYDVTLTQGDNISHQGFIVATNTSGKEGDVLTSISFHDNVSARADTLISRDRTKTLNVLISDINESSLQFSGGSPMFNMTLLDQAWNSLDEDYQLWGTANVTVPAGTFADCNIYGGSKSVVINGETSAVQVFYYMHPSSAVPVMYEVNSTAGLYVYRLTHMYEPGDKAGTPERVVYSFFDDLDNGRLDEAFKCLTTYDQNSGRFKAPDDDTYRQFLDNMNRTYRTGDESYRVQFVNVSSVEPVTSLIGDNISLARWDSIHYQVGTLSVYRLSGSFYVTEIEGQWRIIV